MNSSLTMAKIWNWSNLDRQMTHQELKEVVITGKSQDLVLSVQVDSIMLDVVLEL